MYSVQRETLSPGRPIRYQLMDDSGRTLFTAERTETEEHFNLDQNIRLLDSAGELIARLVPPLDRNLWGSIDTYKLVMKDETEARFTIEQTYSLADRLLLRLPSYKLRASGARYRARGSRHGEHFFELFDSKNHYLGQIERNLHGPTFMIEGEPSPLMQLPLLLAALVVVIDLAETDN